MGFEILGLNKYETEVFKALVKNGKGTAGIISKLSGVPYGRIYDVLESLESKGFISMVPDKTKKYIANDPKDLKKIIEKKKEEITKVGEEIEKLKDFYRVEEEPVTRITGRKNFHKLLDELPNAKKFDYAIKYTAQYDPNWVKGRRQAIKKGVDIKTLTRYDKETETNIQKWLKVNPNIKKIENKGIALEITEDYVWILLLKDNTTVLFRNKDFIDIMKNLFSETYNHSEKILTQL